MGSSRAVVAAAHPAIRGVLDLACREAGIEVVERAETATAAIDACRGRRADVLVLDLDLPDDDGFHVLTELGAERPAAVLILADRADGDLVLRALQLGAGGFVTKADGLTRSGRDDRESSQESAHVAHARADGDTVAGAMARRAREGADVDAPPPPGDGRCSNC